MGVRHLSSPRWRKFGGFCLRGVVHVYSSGAACTELFSRVPAVPLPFTEDGCLSPVCFGRIETAFLHELDHERSFGHAPMAKTRGDFAWRRGNGAGVLTCIPVVFNPPFIYGKASVCIYGTPTELPRYRSAGRERQVGVFFLTGGSKSLGWFINTSVHVRLNSSGRNPTSKTSRAPTAVPCGRRKSSPGRGLMLEEDVSCATTV